MLVDARDKRCVVVTVDPVTLRRGPAIMQATERERDAPLGVYGTTVRPSVVAVGNAVQIEC